MSTATTTPPRQVNGYGSAAARADQPQSLAWEAVAPVAAGCLLLVRQPTCVNLSIYAGDDFVLLVEVTDAQTGQPVDLTNAVVSSQVRATPQSTQVLGTFDPTVIPPNQILLHLPSATTATLPARSVWDLQINLDGIITTLVAGTITVTPEVTRP